MVGHRDLKAVRTLSEVAGHKSLVEARSLVGRFVHGYKARHVCLIQRWLHSHLLVAGHSYHTYLLMIGCPLSHRVIGHNR